MLAEIGIHSVEDLRAMGAEAAFHRLRFVFGKRAVSLNFLYALDGALKGCDWRHLPEGRKAELRRMAARAPVT
jgi:DNA transformation protein